MEKSESSPLKKDSEQKENKASDSNEWSDISSCSDEGGNEGKLEKNILQFTQETMYLCPVLIVIAEWEKIHFAYDQQWHF